jgi:molecular chaperone GrpE
MATEHPEEDQNHEENEQELAPEEGRAQGVELTHDELLELKDRAAKADVHYDSWMRVMADLQNLQRRSYRDKDQARRMAVRDLVKDLIPCFDNLDRALQVGTGAASEGLIAGLTMVSKEIWRVLQENGVQIIDPEGAMLDPNLHEAIGSRFEDGVEANTVLDVWERGYALGDMIIRPARVTVAASNPTSTETPPE